MLVYDIQDLVKYYPKQTQPVNDHITLQIYQGEIFGILGDNGEEKSTLIRQMVNLLRSTSGSIRLLGHNITKDTQLLAGRVQDGLASGITKKSSGQEISLAHCSLTLCREEDRVKKY